MVPFIDLVMPGDTTRSSDLSYGQVINYGDVGGGGRGLPNGKVGGPKLLFLRPPPPAMGWKLCTPLQYEKNSLDRVPTYFHKYK